MVLDHLYRALRLVGGAHALLEAGAVAVGEYRAEVALVLDAPGEDRRARARRRAGLLLALRDDDLVLDVVVDHVHLVLLGHAAVFGGWGQYEHDARFSAC